MTTTSSGAAGSAELRRSVAEGEHGMLSMSIDCFITGLLAGSVAAGRAELDLAGNLFDRAALNAYQFLLDDAWFDLRSHIALHRVHGDSSDARQGLTRAIGRGLLVADFSSGRGWIAVDQGSALTMLDALPTGRGVYIAMASRAFAPSAVPARREGRHSAAITRSPS